MIILNLKFPLHLKSTDFFYFLFWLFTGFFGFFVLFIFTLPINSFNFFFKKEKSLETSYNEESN